MLENKNVFAYAIKMETAVSRQFQEVQVLAPNQLKPFLTLLLQSQDIMSQLLVAGMAVDPAHSHFPEPDLTASVANDMQWKQAGEIMLTPEELSVALACLWSAGALLDKTGQFYRQAGINSIYPTERIFFSSLAEVKLLLRRRTNGITQSLGNQLWTEIGFSPFTLAKE